jgi:anti-sigma regulatory factor (Ser/Thr protein kinase)
VTGAFDLRIDGHLLSIESLTPVTLEVPADREAPRIARHHLRSSLANRLPPPLAHDVGLIVSELVTISVLHAGAGSGQTVGVAVSLSDGRLHLTVTDSRAASSPGLIDLDLDHPAGLGLFFVDRLSASWGVERDAAGRTTVWCDFALGDEPAS